ncbi:MAG: protease HtpX [Polyangiales bacterium]
MRILLLIVTNLAVSLLLGAVFLGLELAGVMPSGQWGYLFVSATVFGFGGSFVSLLLSKTMAKWSLGVRVIEQPQNEMEYWLLETVRQHAARAGIGMPEVGYYDAGDPNAFATGWSRDNALVAVSTGLTRVMGRDQVAAVLGHEVAHVANGDMVTLTLLQGVLNTFVIFFSRAIAFALDAALSRRGNDDDGPRHTGGLFYGLVSMVLQVVLGIGASLVVAWFSRWREFRADAGGAQLTSPHAMAGALDALRRVGDDADLPKGMAAFGIHGGNLLALFASHPPLEERIARLMNPPR